MFGIHVARRIDEVLIQHFISNVSMKGPLGRPKHRWEDSTEEDLKEKVCEYELDSCSSGYYPAATCCEHGNVSSSFIKGGKFLRNKDTVPCS